MGDRTHCISVRMNDTEVKELDRRRGAVQRGKFLRDMFLGKREPRQIPEVNQQKYIETSRWASNLNQLAHALNGADEVEVNEVRRILAGFRQALIGLKDDGK